MQMSITTMVLNVRRQRGNEKGKHVPCAGNVVQVFGFKNESPQRSWLSWNFQKTSFAPQNGPEKPQSKLLKTTVVRCYK